MKAKISILFLLCCLLNNKAQSQSVPADPNLLKLYAEKQAADFIVEAELISQKYFPDTSKYTDGGKWELNTFKIVKIFKGALTCGTIEVLCKKIVGSSHGAPELSFGSNPDCKYSMLFLKKNLGNFYNPAAPIKSTNVYRTRVDYGFNYISQAKGYVIKSMGHSQKPFQNYQDFRKYFDPKISLTFKPCLITKLDTPATVAPPSSNPKQPIKPSDFAPPQPQKNNNIRPQGKGKMNTDREIFIDLINLEVSGNNNRYIEFDIAVSCVTANTYLSSFTTGFSFNENLIGLNALANSKISVTLGTDFQYYTDAIPMFWDVNLAGNLSGIGMGVQHEDPGKTLLSSTPKVLAHVEIETGQYCNTNTLIEVALMDPPFTSGHGYTTSASEPGWGDNFTLESSHNQSYDFVTCQTFVSEFTSSGTGFHGGIGELLTIKGASFGSSRGSGSVKFKSADENENTFYSIDPRDYVSWSDNEIVIKLPSTSFTITGEPTPCCQFQVVNSSSDASANKDINIIYSVLNHYGTTVTQPSIVIGKNDTKGYSIVVNPSIYNNPDKLLCLTQAMREWSCSTGVNWTLTTSASITPSTTDNICYIYETDLGYSDLANTTLASTHGRTEDYPDQTWARAEFEIKINNNTDLLTNHPWEYKIDPNGNITSGNIDFYQMIMHELGHALGLNHVADPAEVMYYHNLAVTDRANISVASSQAGGKYVVDLSAGSSNFYTTSPSYTGDGKMKKTGHDLQMADFRVPNLAFPNLIIGDAGQEPNYFSTKSPNHNIWNSPWLWNRVIQDGGLIHQNPEYYLIVSLPGPNYLYYKVKNIGCVATVANQEKLHLYWTIASSGEKWPGDWDGTRFHPLSEPWGKEITTTAISLPALAPGEETINYIAWYPPRPQNYDPFFTTLPVCVLGRITTNTSADYGMMFKETTGVHVGTNVFFNNNIATKNLIVNNLNGFSKAAKKPIVFTNASSTPGNFNFALSDYADPITAHDFFEIGYATVYLGEDLFTRWETNGSEGTGITADELTYSIRLNTETASINDLDLDGDEKLFVEIEFSLFDSLSTFDADTFYVSLSQHRVGAVSGEIEGAIVFEIDVDDTTVGIGMRGQEKEENIGIDIFPNAVTEMLIVRADKPIPAQPLFEVFDVLGRKVMEQRATGTVFLQQRINTESLAAGAYFIKMTYSGSKPKVYKFIKR